MIGAAVEPVLLSAAQVTQIQAALLKRGQLAGIKSEDGLQSAVGRVAQAAHYDTKTDWARLAAYYWHAVTTSHAFHDGNKRAGFVAMLAFLEMNGFEFVGPDDEMGPLIYRLFELDRFDLEVLDHIVRRNLRSLVLADTEMAFHPLR